MPSQSLPDFDALWDYSHPGQTEAKFRELLAHLQEDDPAFLELLTQIGRAQGLQQNFEHAHQTLDQVEQRLALVPSRPKVRYLLERGRVLNSSGNAETARSFFEEALVLAEQLEEDFYSIDALHMLAIVAPPGESLAWNRKAIERAESSRQEKARGWLGSLYNNLGWSFHDLGDYTSALEIFEKAESWQRSKGRGKEGRVAAWCIARTLRSLGRLDEALSRQLSLLEESRTAGESDGFVWEEIGECLLALERAVEARPYFLKAHELLSQDPWLAEREPERLARLKQLGG